MFNTERELIFNGRWGFGLSLCPVGLAIVPAEVPFTVTQRLYVDTHFLGPFKRSQDPTTRTNAVYGKGPCAKNIALLSAVSFAH